MSQNTVPELSERIGTAEWLETMERTLREAEWDYAIPRPPQIRAPPRALVSSASLGARLIFDWGRGGWVVALTPQ